MSDTQIESEKALNLARKYDDQGDLSSAIKWCNKSIAIESTPAAKALLSRLQTKGVNGASGSSSSSSSSGGAPTNGTTTTKKPSAAAATPEKQKERAYTSEQLAVVKRIRSAGGDFYKVLSVEKTVDDNGIKKAYRKLALQLHPDKNGAPGADEAFKSVSKAFTVLSDADKRAQYDRYGGDPDQRGSAPSMSSFARGPSAGGPMYTRGGFGGGGDEIDPQDLFNMFFGGGLGGGMGMGMGGTTFTFGGPGMQRTYYRTGGGGGGGGGGRQQQPAQNPYLIWQLLPILILGLFSLLSYIPAMFGPQEPHYSFAPSGRFRDQKVTAKRGVAYYVDRREWQSNDLVNGRVGGASSHSSGSSSSIRTSSAGLKNFENKVEQSWKNVLYNQCSTFRDYQEQRIDRTKGFFGIGADREAEMRIRKESSTACEELLNFGISIPIRA